MKSSAKIINYISFGFVMIFLTIGFLFFYLYFGGARTENLKTTEGSHQNAKNTEIKNSIVTEGTGTATENKTADEKKREEILRVLKDSATASTQMTSEEKILDEKKRQEILNILK